MVFSLLLALICIGFIYVAIWPLSNRGTRCLQKCFVIPIFVLMVVLSWAFSLVFVIGSIGLADMCYDSPDDNFRLLVTKLQSNFSPIVFRMILFYVSGTYNYNLHSMRWNCEMTMRARICVHPFFLVVT